MIIKYGKRALPSQSELRKWLESLLSGVSPKEGYRMNMEVESMKITQLDRTKEQGCSFLKDVLCKLSWFILLIDAMKLLFLRK